MTDNLTADNPPVTNTDTEVLGAALSAWLDGRYGRSLHSDGWRRWYLRDDDRKLQEIVLLSDDNVLRVTDGDIQVIEQRRRETLVEMAHAGIDVSQLAVEAGQPKLDLYPEVIEALRQARINQFQMLLALTSGESGINAAAVASVGERVERAISRLSFVQALVGTVQAGFPDGRRLERGVQVQRRTIEIDATGRLLVKEGETVVSNGAAGAVLDRLLDGPQVKGAKVEYLRLAAGHAIAGDLRTCWCRAEMQGALEGTPVSGEAPVAHRPPRVVLTPRWQTWSRRQVDRAKLAPLVKVVAPANTHDWRFLQEEAGEVLISWLLDDAEAEPLDGLWPVLLPAAVLRRLEPKDGADALAWLARAWPNDAPDFVERWNLACPGTPLDTPAPEDDEDLTEAERQARFDVARADRAAMDRILHKAWPLWWGWEEDALRSFTLDEFTFNQQTGEFWDIVRLRPVPTEALPSLIPKVNWARDTRTNKLVPPKRWFTEYSQALRVSSAIWMPGHGRLVRGWVASPKDVRREAGALALNLWREPPLLRRTSDRDFAIKAPPGASARRWFQLLAVVIPERRIRHWAFRWFAYLLQNPDKMPQGVLVLSGAQGIGKDALLFAICQILGMANVYVLSPDQVTDNKYNPFLRSKLCIVSEVRASFIEGGARGLYGKIKEYTTSPPETATMVDKYEKAVAVLKLAGWVMTTNELSELFTPPDDRRQAIAHSNASANWHLNKDPGFFVRYFDGMETGDAIAVRDKLMACNLGASNPNDPPPMSEAKKMALVASTPADNPLTRALEHLWRKEKEKEGTQDDGDDKTAERPLEQLWRKEKAVTQDDGDDKTAGQPAIVFGGQIFELANRSEFAGLFLLISRNKWLDRAMAEQGYAILPPAGSAKRWTFRATVRIGGCDERTRKFTTRAYVLKELLGDPALVEKVIERGRLWAADEPPF